MFYLFLALAVFLCVKAIWNLLSITVGRQPYSRKVIERLRFIVFLKFFSNSLMVSFFPQYIAVLVRASHLPAMVTSFSYILYQICFLLMLLPGGYFGEMRSVKKIVLVVTFIESLLFFGLGLIHTVWLFLLLQLLFGCAIPLSSSAEYAYLLHFSRTQNRAEGFALYANSLKGALIAGAIIGGALAKYFSYQQLFFIAAILVLLDLFFAWFLLPAFKSSKALMQNRRYRHMAFTFVLKKLPALLLKKDFFRMTLGVGFAIGLIDDGVVLFSLPLLLSYYHVAHAVIAQLLVLVSIGFFMSNRIISRRADQLKNRRRFVQIGFFGLTAALLLFALSKQFSSIHGWLFTLSAALLLLGLFRGFVVGPASALIVEHEVGSELGKNVVLSLFRVCQMIGSIVGPVLLMMLFENLHYHMSVYAVIAVIVFCLGLMGVLYDRRLAADSVA